VPGPQGKIGRYRLYDVIASGGMAVIHLGRLVGAAGFSRTVAIKRLHPQLSTNTELLTMLVDEAHLAARVRHPNVAPIFDVVVEGSEVCLVLEYVHGESLSRLLSKAQQNGERMPVGVALSIISGVLNGLSAAHEATGDDGRPLGLVHRDISPQNVLVGLDGIARLIDFGVAKATSRLQTTHVGQVKGKFAYMAPEQLSLAPIDARTDLFAVGVVLWEILTCRPLFDSTDLGAVARRVAGGSVEPPSVHAPDVPPDLEQIVMRALSSRPEDRFPSAAAMARALAQITPVASMGEVSSWVRRVGGEELARREARVAAVESGVDLEPAAIASEELPTAVPHSLSGAPPAAANKTGKRPMAGRVVIALVAAGGLTLAFASGARFSRTTPSQTPRVERSDPPSVDSGQPEAPPVASSAEASIEAPSPSASAAQAPARRRAPPLPRSSAHVASTPGSSERPSYCSMRKLAFTVGPDGIERPRPECL
jgi:serine/threonine-protein kinase